MFSRGSHWQLSQRGRLLGAAILLAVPVAAGASDAPPPAGSDSAWRNWLTGDYATGDWGGARTTLEEWGITPEVAYTTDILAARNGNAGSGDGWDYAGRFDFGINFDLEKLAGISGLSFYTSGAWSSGTDLSDRKVGNVFAVQEIFTGREVRLSQLYLQQDLLDDRLSFKIGRLTTEADFLASDLYTLYVNGGINGLPSNIPDGNVGFTTAPFAQWGVVAAGEPVENLRLALGVYNASDDAADDRKNGTNFELNPGNGLLAVAEVSYGWNQPPEDGPAIGERNPDYPLAHLPGMIKVGGLFETGDREDLKDENNNKEGNPGVYLSLEQMVYHEPDSEDQGLTPWFVVTYLPRQSINELPVFFGGGLVYKGLIPTRDDDHAAVGFYYGNLSKDVDPGGSEKVLELAYNVQLTKFFYVRPDLQLVFDPAGVGSADTAIVGGGEIGITF
jgi:porin